MSLFEELEPPLQIYGTTRDEDETPPLVLPLAEPSQPVLPLVDLLPSALPLVEPSPPVLPEAEPSPPVLPLAEPSPPVLPLDNEHSLQEVLLAGVSSPVLSGPLSSVSSGSSQYFTPDPSPNQSPRRQTQGEENTAGEVEIQANKKKGETSQTDILKRKVFLFSISKTSKIFIDWLLISFLFFSLYF
jgi:hypothetical protein